MKSEDNRRVACEGGSRLRMPEDGSRIPAFGLAALDFRNEFSEWRLQRPRSTLPWMLRSLNVLTTTPPSLSLSQNFVSRSTSERALLCEPPATSRTFVGRNMSLCGYVLA